MQRLRTYTLHFHDGEVDGQPVGQMSSFDIIECQTDEEARSRAIALLAHHPKRHAVEVWSDDRPVMVVKGYQPHG